MERGIESVDSQQEDVMEGGLLALTTWWWRYATGWSSRYSVKVSVIKGDFAVVGFPRMLPGWDKNVGFVFRY